MWETILGVRHVGCPVSDTSAAHHDVHIQNLSKVSRNDGPSKRLLRLQGEAEAISAFVDEFRGREEVQSFEPISRSTDGLEHYVSTELRFPTDNPSINSLVTRKHCHHYPTVNVRRGIERWILYTESKGVIVDLMDDLEEHDNETDLIRSVNITGSNSGVGGFSTLFMQLTERQRVTFETALEEGYYEDGTDVTVEDIGERLDVHPTTSWEHLSKAENQILRSIGERLIGYDTNSKPTA